MRRYADEFFLVAEDALKAYRARSTNRHHAIVPFAIYYNYLHAIELGLKSFMLHTGSKLPELRGGTGVGHNLEAALDICLARDLLDACPEFTEALQSQVKLANQTYRFKEFEYIRIGAGRLPHIDQVVSAAGALLSGLRLLNMRPAQRPRQED